jgi:PAS domain S-box-containing protein
LNPAWETVLGYSNKELMSRPFLDFIHPDDRENSRREFESLIAGRQTVDFENRYRQKEGSFRHLSWMATPLPDEQRLYAVARDITKRKAAEEELEHYQLKLKTLAMQLTITEERERHRIANDLHDQVAQSLVLMRMQIASLDKFATEYGLKDTLDDMSVSLRQSIQKTRDLIYDLSPPQLNEIGLSAAIQEWLKKHVTERFGIKAECTVEGPERQLDNQLRAILFRNSRELVINAIKHAQATQVKVSVLLEENQIIIIVRDDGIGFEAGADSTSSDTGSGFGLFSVKERMVDMGGSLEILSEPGQGSEVIMSLPLERG